MIFSSLVYAADDICSTGCCVDGVPTLKCLENIFGNLLTFATGFFILGFFIMFIIGAFNYLTSLGNPEKIKKAQGTLKFAFIGLFLFLGSYLILNLICFIFFNEFGSSCRLFKFEIPGP